MMVSVELGGGGSGLAWPVELSMCETFGLGLD